MESGTNLTQRVGDASVDRFDCQAVATVRAMPSLRDDVERGFARSPRSLPPKYFYDGHGSELFDRICDTAEYYPTRAETALLEAHAEAIIARVQPDHLIELGSGSCRKTRHLLSACAKLGHGAYFWPFDVCEEMLVSSGQSLVEEFPNLRVTALVGDYLGGLGHLPRPVGRRLFVFLGGTIGNFSELEAHQFLLDLRAHMHVGDCLLLGADRVKDPAVLEAAYNDAAGITADFDLNVLSVINRELGADFDLSGFRHRAIYNEELSQIEMYLIAQRDQLVRVPALEREYHFRRDERLLTEISRKFSRSGLERSLAAAGFEIEQHFEGGEQLFSLVLACAGAAHHAVGSEGR
jgi:L-histidine N-alpha-methyltransferase